MHTGESTTTEVGLNPFISAVAYTYGLNEEPGWRIASVARLNWPSLWKPASTRLSRTRLARARAAGRLICGANLEGALNRPASIAASARFTSRADLLK